MSYIDAFLERDKDRINVVERVEGKRFYKTYPTRYMFYYHDSSGEYKSIYGNRLSRFATRKPLSLSSSLTILMASSCSFPGSKLFLGKPVILEVIPIPMHPFSIHI